MGVTRRDALKAGAIGAGAIGTGIVAAAGAGPALAQGAARTFVLVHGAWHGGWCWRDVAAILRAKGHRVYTPSLPGLAEHSHLLTTSINLDTHINDVANLFLWEDIENAVLVGHSYGGWPISGAVEKIGARVSSIVYLDAFLPSNGERGFDTTSAQFQAQLKDAVAKGEAGRPVPPASAFKVIDPKNVAWVQSKMTQQPVGVAMQPIALTGARDKIARKTYIRASAYPQPLFDKYLAQCKADPSWKTYEFKAEEAGHDVMVDAPQRLAEILLERT